jgi:curved DNA-binding protein CbpA
VSSNGFIDFYEALQVSPNADSETVERVFRHLAKRYHPDNPQTGDTDHFRMLVDAHRTLTDPESRASYDARYQQGVAQQWSMVEEAIGCGEHEGDQVLRDRLLSLLYVQRRRDVLNPSMGNVELEKLLACPEEHLEFHVWYLKEKGYVQRTDKGYAITAEGIDYAEASRALITRERLITENAGPNAGPVGIPSTTNGDPSKDDA